MNSAPDTTVTPRFPVFPLKNGVAFPNMMLPITAGRPGSLAAVEAALATEDKQIAVFSQRDASIEEPATEDLYAVGTLCVIRRMQRREGVIQIMLQGRRRIERAEVVQTSPFPLFQVGYLPEPMDAGPEVEALQRTMLDLAARMLSLGPPQMQIDLEKMVADLERPIQQAYVLASLTSIDVDKHNRLFGRKRPGGGATSGGRLPQSGGAGAGRAEPDFQGGGIQDEQGPARDDAAPTAQ
ncbi:MAG: LON peptidase substrate-binding domain-containing protein [Chromatiaceae bacterium]|nr:LON peptidase substrate-binding domain-containing protein [Chromatiaceae bacterium]